MIEIPLHMIPHTRVLRRILQPARSRQIRKVRRNLRQRVLNRAIGQLLGRQPLRSCAQIRRRARAARPSWRQRRIRPGHRIEVKEVQQIRLGRVSRRKVGIRTNKPALHKFDHGRVIHWDMRHIVPTRERRDHDVRDTKPQLRREPLLRRRIPRAHSRIAAPQIAMSAPRHQRTRLKRIRIHRNALNIRRNALQRRRRIVIRVSRNGRDMVIRPATLVIA